jgi:hypothetical protein
VLVERLMKSVFLPALLCVLGGGSGGGAKGACAQANMYDEKVPASVAAALAMYRSESCFVDWIEPQDSRRSSTNNPTPQPPTPHQGLSHRHTPAALDRRTQVFNRLLSTNNPPCAPQRSR